jgi:nucleoside-diphosphate-sugar epimerase
LTEKILETTDWSVAAFDLNDGNLKRFESSKAFLMRRGDIFEEDAWIEEQVAVSDAVLPLAGIAKPAYYLSHPLWTFELDFEQNLKVVRFCVKHGKRVVFPSTSEVYGLTTDDVLDEDSSPLILGTIDKMRWIYSCGKQMMDRIITAYGREQGLRYTIFRPFNWVGPRLDTWKDAQERTARSFTQMMHDVLKKGEITLVGSGEQRRSFTWIGDGTDALMTLLRNEEGRADGQIFNVGNPGNNASIKELAQIIVDVMRQMPEYAPRVEKVRFLSVPAEEYYRNGYDDMRNRVPSIAKIERLMHWTPKVNLRETVKRTLESLNFDE